jgi:hypothetical protein
MVEASIVLCIDRLAMGGIGRHLPGGQREGRILFGRRCRSRNSGRRQYGKAGECQSAGWAPNGLAGLTNATYALSPSTAWSSSG